MVWEGQAPRLVVHAHRRAMMGPPVGWWITAGAAGVVAVPLPVLGVQW